MSAELSVREAPPRLRDEASPQGNALEQMVWHTGGARASARARVWERLAVAKTPDRPARIARWCLGGAVLACGVVLAAWGLRAPTHEEQWQLEQAEGTVLLESSAGSQAALPGAVPGGARLRVGEASAAMLARGAARLLLAPGAVVQLDVQPVLLEGAAAVRVPDARRFRLAAGAAVFEGSGGVFVAEASATRTSVRAESGSLRVLGAAEATEVAPGSSWSAGLGDRAPSAGEPRPEHLAADALARLMREPQLPPPTQLRRLARLQPNPPAPDAAAELLARAHQAESAGRYAEAAGLYAQLASLDDPRASAALYELARLQLRFLGQPASALASLEEQRTRFPESPLAQEAALSAIDARLALGEDTASLREMDAFLAQFPSSERAGEVRWLRARLALRRGDCGSAREDLTALVAVGAYSGEALLAQALCARRAGDEPAARAFLRDYLKRDPHGSRRGEAQAALSGGPLGAP